MPKMEVVEFRGGKVPHGVVIKGVSKDLARRLGAVTSKVKGGLQVTAQAGVMLKLGTVIGVDADAAKLLSRTQFRAIEKTENPAEPAGAGGGGQETGGPGEGAGAGESGEGSADVGAGEGEGAALDPGGEG